jgi:signal transduction histidine kinase
VEARRRETGPGGLSDSGPGIPEALPRLYDPDFSSKDGSGIGLHGARP